MRSDCAVLILMEVGGLSLQAVILILLNVASLVGAWIYFFKDRYRGVIVLFVVLLHKC